MRLPQRAILFAMVTFGATACATATTEVSRPRQIELLQGAKIEVSDAIKAALVKAPGRVLDTELRGKQPGRTVWEVDILTADGKVVEVDVDATSGQVVDSEEHR